FLLLLLLPLLLSPSIDRRQSILAVPPNSGRSAYRSAGGSVRTVRYVDLPLDKANLGFESYFG
ncbi:hypothetical protein B296_00033259, partial [Ensete ventricosum]